MNQQTSETKRDEIDLNEMNLLWDEYKYRHDLIWRHLIRSTVAVIALITVSYTTNFQADKTIFIFGAVLAAIYTMFNFFVLKSEITLFEKIKKLYWERQNKRFFSEKPSENKKEKQQLTEFSRYVDLYSKGLIILSLLAIITTILK